MFQKIKCFNKISKNLNVLKMKMFQKSRRFQKFKCSQDVQDVPKIKMFQKLEFSKNKNV